MSQIIRDEDALVVPISPRDVAGTLKRVLFDPALAASMSERGRTVVEQHHDRAHEMDRLERLYRDLAGVNLHSGPEPSR